jgi:hypothetical protein
MAMTIEEYVDALAIYLQRLTHVLGRAPTKRERDLLAAAIIRELATPDAPTRRVQ